MATIYLRGTLGRALTWTEADNNITNLNTAKLENVVEDTTPQLGGNLDVNGNSIVSTSNGNITISPNGTGSVIIDGLSWPQTDGTADYVLKTNGSGQLSWTAQTSGGGITDIVQDTTPQLGGNLDVNSYSIVSASNGNISITPNGTGKTVISSINYNEGSIYDLGTTGGTITPNVTNGNVQKITLNSALTMNAFTSPVAGQSLTLIIYGGTAYTSITSTMKFAGGVKTLTGTASCIDILSVYYDGTTYFASLNKGFA